MRINRYLAECGVASRRKSEELVLAGKVRLNGRLVKELSTEVGPKDIVTVDGAKIAPVNSHIYLMLNKPKGVLTTTSDERGRKTVMDFVPAYAGTRLFPVGRLDYDTEGLLILTTDGELANVLTHPRHEITKTYVAKVEGEVTEEELNRLKSGVVLDGVKTKRCKAVLLEFKDGMSRVEITISEGRNRQVRRMFEALGRQVDFLKRVSIGGLRLGGLSRGEYRELSEKEIAMLKC